METFTKLFGSWLTLVYHCFDRIVIQGYLPPGVPLRAAAVLRGWAGQFRRRCMERTGPPAQQLVLFCE